MSVLDALDPKRAALILIHWQRDVITAEGALGGHFAATVQRSGALPRTVEVVAAARAAGIRVIYANVGYQAAGTEIIVNSPVWSFVRDSDALRRGSVGAEVVTELEPEQGELVLEHGRLSIFADTVLDAWLRGNGIDTLFFAGVATNVAVESTARTATDSGYRTVLISDCCMAATEETHAASVASLSSILSEVTDSRAVLVSLAASARG